MRVKDVYWDRRCERWGAWRVGAAGIKVATWAGLRAGGGSFSNWSLGDDAVPELHVEERETHEFVVALAQRPEGVDLARFALAAYPRSSRLATRLQMDKSAISARRALLFRTLARMLDQRRRGEPIDPKRRPVRGRALTVTASMPGSRKPRALASVVQE